MTGRTHDIAAITFLAAIALSQPLQSLSLSTILLSVLANQIGGIVPDIDQPTAPFWRNLPIGKYIGRAADKLMGGHRFLTHSLIGVILFSILASMIIHFGQLIFPASNNNIILFSFIIGILSHLVMDSLTKEGVPWLLPLPIKFGIPPAKKWRITTGKKIETLIIFPGFILLDILLVSNNYQRILFFTHHLLK